MASDGIETTNTTLVFGDRPKRSVVTSMLRGFRRRCPSCGEGKVFGSFLKVNDHCPSCGEALYHHRADDAPPYFTIFVVGHILIPVAALVERNYAPDMVLQAFTWSTAAILMSLWFLPRIKGSLIGLQWANYMHGFGGEDDGIADDALPEYIDR